MPVSYAVPRAVRHQVMAWRQLGASTIILVLSVRSALPQVWRQACGRSLNPWAMPVPRALPGGRCRSRTSINRAGGATDALWRPARRTTSLHAGIRACSDGRDHHGDRHVIHAPAGPLLQARAAHDLHTPRRFIVTVCLAPLVCADPTTAGFAVRVPYVPPRERPPILKRFRT